MHLHVVIMYVTVPIIIPIVQLPVYVHVGKSYCHSIDWKTPGTGRPTYACTSFELGNWSRDAKVYESSGEKLSVKSRSLKVTAITKVHVPTAVATDGGTTIIGPQRINIQTRDLHRSVADELE